MIVLNLRKTGKKLELAYHGSKFSNKRSAA